MNTTHAPYTVTSLCESTSRDSRTVHSANEVLEAVTCRECRQIMIEMREQADRAHSQPDADM